MLSSDLQSTEKVIRYNPASLTALLNPEPDTESSPCVGQSSQGNRTPAQTFSINGDNNRDGKKVRSKPKEPNPFYTTSRGIENNRGEFSSTRSVSSNGSTISTFTTFPFTTVTVTPHQPGQSQAKRRKITPEQLKDLLAMFEKTDSPSFEAREKLAKKLNMTNREIQVWFQNRRAKVNRERSEAANRQQKSAKGTSANQRGSNAAKDGTNDKPTSVHAYPPSQYLRYQNEPPPGTQPNYKQRIPRIPPPIKVVSPNFNMPPSPISPYGQSLSPRSQSRFSMQTLLSPLNSASSSGPGLSSPQWCSPTHDTSLMTPTSDNTYPSPTNFTFAPQSHSESASRELPSTLEPQVYLSDSSPVTAHFPPKHLLHSAQPPNYAQINTLKPLRKRAFSVDANSMDVLVSVAVHESTDGQHQGHKRSNSASWKNRT